MLRTASAALGGALLAQLLPFHDVCRDACGPWARERAILSHVRLVALDDGTGRRLPTLRFEGVNVQVVNGEGATATVNGLGNLLVGYQEDSAAPERTGSHNLVVGFANDYTSWGGVATGGFNRIGGPAAAVIGGDNNVAGEGLVLGGSNNTVDPSGAYGVIVGGFGNHVGQGFANSVFGSEESRILAGPNGTVQNVVVGGSGHTVENGSFNGIFGGQRSQLSGRSAVSVVGGQEIP